jgi:hypothetical protein
MILLYNFDLLQIHIPYMSQDISVELITAKYLSLFYKYACFRKCIIRISHPNLSLHNAINQKALTPQLNADDQI